MNSNEHYRSVAQTVMRVFLENGDGCIRVTDNHSVFDPALIDYRIDVERVMKKLTRQEQMVLLGIHQNGMAHEEALQLAGVNVERPDAYVARLEVKAGKLFEAGGVSDVLTYLT